MTTFIAVHPRYSIQDADNLLFGNPSRHSFPPKNVKTPETNSEKFIKAQRLLSVDHRRAQFIFPRTRKKHILVHQNLHATFCSTCRYGLLLLQKNTRLDHSYPSQPSLSCSYFPEFYMMQLFSLGFRFFCTEKNLK